MLAYLVVSGMFCFPGITSSTISPGLVSKNPGRAPSRAVVWRASLVHARLGCLGGFRCGSPACALSGSFPWTHSQRETWFFFPPRTAGSLTARVLMDGGSDPHQVSTLLFSLPWDAVSSLSLYGPSQLSPAPQMRLALSATPRCFPIQTKDMSTSLTRLFGVHGQIMFTTLHTLTRNHTLSLSDSVTPLSGYHLTVSVCRSGYLS